MKNLFRPRRGSRRTTLPKSHRRRNLVAERLESRHLLAGEGLGFDVSRAFNTTGLVGSLSSTIKWGDNTQSAGSVSGTVDNNGPLSIKFEYVGSFFNDPARKTALQNAASSVIERFSDDLQAIQPDSFLKWTAVTSNPTTGAEMSISNLAVAQNQLVIYVGGRTFSGNKVGEAFPGFARTNYPGLYTPAEIARIQAFQDTIQYRGQTGAKGANPTDIGPWGGYISFDNDTKWHFGGSSAGLDDDEVDFSSVVVHEMMHVLGFGVNYVGSVNSSFETFSSGLNFTGPKAKAIYGGNVPLGNIQHFADQVTSNGQQSAITERVDKGDHKVITPIDVAALDDIGWTVRAAPTATVTASHVYADNPNTGSTYPVEVILRGSQLGELTQSLTASVTNTPPTLTVPSNQSFQVAKAFTITNIGSISDPGFSSPAAGSTETFTYSINWGDGNTDAGDATIDRVGSATATTLASFDGGHSYASVGSYTVSVVATDDDGGSKSASFTITVTPPPVLRLALSTSQIDENAGNAAATLTVTRTGSLTAAQVVNLSSNDTTEATVAASVTIPAGQASVTTPVNAVDDTLLDGTQGVVLTATATGFVGGEVDLQVRDAESLAARFVGGNIREANTTTVVLRITRSNTDTAESLNVNISGGNSGQLTVPSQATIEVGQQSVSVPLVPVQDNQAELTKTLDYVIASGGYASANASVDVLDDELPRFQNQLNRYDADGLDGLTPNDILTVINQLVIDGNDAVLNPETRAFEGLYYDVDGNYLLTPNDIKEVIEELARLRDESRDPSEEGLATTYPSAASDFLPVASNADSDDDEEDVYWS